MISAFSRQGTATLADTAKIRSAIDSTIRALEARPQNGIGTSTTTATLVDGFRCEVSEGRWTLQTDLSEGDGGGDAGPTPGVLGRGALASCLAMGIVIQAAQMGIGLDALTIEVQCDWDASASLGLNDATPPGYTEVRVAVRLASSAPKDQLRDLVRIAERYSSYVDVFRRAQDVAITLEANGVPIALR